ncbi:unnamed protein product [Litomosoides sigmodontis]|uniref:Uncharacterized protein n=1 Tax=Litomosoides sigmodontis TaxID=42156 RepID=A0A3P6T0S9_LITSI|nr:unnamed protein product [Litomosoides sigmodontis]
MKIRRKAEKLYENATPELVVHSKRSKRRKRSKHSLPSKRMKIQLSLKNEPETSADREAASKKEPKKKELLSVQNEVRTETNATLPYDESKKFSDELPVPDIKDSLALFGSHDSSPLTPISIKKKPTFSALKAQDSLMLVNSQTSLQPSSSAEKINEKVGFKDKFMGTSVLDSDDDKSSFVAAKAQDSLMVVNDLKPLQPSASAEQTNLEDSNNNKVNHK